MKCALRTEGGKENTDDVQRPMPPSWPGKAIIPFPLSRPPACHLCPHQAGAFNPHRSPLARAASFNRVLCEVPPLEFRSNWGLPRLRDLAKNPLHSTNSRPDVGMCCKL